MKNYLYIFFIIVIIANGHIYGQVSLNKAVEENDLFEAQKQIFLGADPNEHSNKDCYPIRKAIEKNAIPMIEFLLINGAVSDTCKDEHSIESYDHYSPFYIALINNNFEVVDLFVRNGYDINKRMNRVEFTFPVIAAVELRKMDFFNYFCEKGARLNVKDYLGKNALMYSIEGNNLELSKLLIEKGCPVNDVANNGYTTLMFAAASPGINFEIIDLLINNGVDIDHYNSDNESALSLACLTNNRDLAFYLCEHGVKGKQTFNGFESNARMNHFLGDYYLARGDIENARQHYLDAKPAYFFSIENEKKELARVNRLKAAVILLDASAQALNNYAVDSYAKSQVSMFETNTGINLSNSQKNMLASTYADNYKMLFSPIYKNNPDLYTKYQLPVNAGLDEQKYYYKSRIEQFETSLFLIDQILTCIDSGKTGTELNSCVQEIELSKEK